MPAGEPRRGKDVAWRRDPIILDRLPEVERLHLEGKHDAEIARELGVGRSTIQRDRERLEELWLERASAQIANHRARRIAELEHIKREALAAYRWDLAAEAAVLYNETPDGHVLGVQYHGDDDEDREGDEDEPADVPTIRRVQRGRSGTASFRGGKAAALSVARQAIMDMAKLAGAVVEKQEHTGRDGAPIEVRGVVGQMTDDELDDRIEQLLAGRAGSLADPA